MLLWGGPTASWAAVLLVPNQYPSIRQAVEAAQPQDTIRVAAGTYAENIILRPGITLEGGWDSTFSRRDIFSNTTVIDGSSRGGFALFGADQAVIDGFTITGGSPPPFMPEAEIGAGVYCDSITLTLKNNLITGNNAAGIYSHACRLTVTNNALGANGKAGIYLENNSVAVIAENIISHNLAAGINAGGEALSKVEIKNNIIHSNKRAGVNVVWAAGALSNNVIYNNEEAGIRAGTSGPLLLANNTIVGNTMAGIVVAEPEDIASQQLEPMISNNIIANNGQAGIKSRGVGYSYNLLYNNNQVQGFEPESLWYIRLQFGGYEDLDSIEKNNNIIADPLFVNPAQHNYRLRPGSPAIDTGNPDPRFHDQHFGPSLGAATNDLGAYGGPGTLAEQRQSNALPVAALSPLQEAVYAGDTITVDGSKSYDPDGDEIHYEWALLNRPFNSAAQIQPLKNDKGKGKFSADVAGEYMVRLTVKDRWAAQAHSQMLRIRVEQDRPPVAKINKPQEPVKVGETLTLFSYDHTTQAENLNYIWVLTRKPAYSTAVLANSTAARPSLTVDAPGCYSIMLTVHNGIQYSTPDTVHICSKESPTPGKRMVPSVYPTIQDALDVAEVGEDVLVQAGTYKENLIIDKAVNLIGIGRPVIDGGNKEGDGSTIFVCYLDNEDSGKIQGFVVTGGGTGSLGHGIQILNSSPEIFDNHIRGNHNVGVGIHGMKRFTEQTKIHNNLIFDNGIGASSGLGASGQIYNNTIHNNRITGMGVRGLATPILRNNTVYNNAVGIGIREEAYPVIEGNKIYQNMMGLAINPGTAGAIYAEKHSLSIKNNYIHDNRRAGIFISSLNRSDVVLQDNTIQNTNLAGTYQHRSGGVVIGYPHEALTKVMMERNTINNNRGMDVQHYSQLGQFVGEKGDSASRRPNF